MADDGFEVPRLAQLYDPLDPDSFRYTIVSKEVTA